MRVPAQHLIGEEGMGFMYVIFARSFLKSFPRIAALFLRDFFRYIVHNFNHERFVIAVAASRAARTCYEEALKHRL